MTATQIETLGWSKKKKKATSPSEENNLRFPSLHKLLCHPEKQSVDSEACPVTRGIPLLCIPLINHSLTLSNGSTTSVTVVRKMVSKQQKKNKLEVTDRIKERL